MFGLAIETIVKVVVEVVIECGLLFESLLSKLHCSAPSTVSPAALAETGPMWA